MINNYSKRVLAILLIFFGALSCQENELSSKQDMDIAKAKNWFEKNLAILSGSNSNSRITTNLLKTPDWNKTKVHLLRNGFKMIEVVLNYETNLLFSQSEKLPPGRFNVLNSMLLIEIRPNEYGIYLLKTYPENPTIRIDLKDFDNLNFGKIKDDFSGSMMLFDWDESFMGGWKISNGVRTHFYGKTPTKKSSFGRENSNSALSCYAIDLLVFTDMC